MEHRVGGGDGVWARERSVQKLQEGEADTGEPRGWIKRCQVMGRQRRRDSFPPISGPLVPLLSQLELFPVWTASQCVKQNSVVEMAEHFWSSTTLHSPCLSKWRDCCEGLNEMNQASLCGGVLCSPPSGCFRPGCQAGVGSLLIPRTGRQSAQLLPDSLWPPGL